MKNLTEEEMNAVLDLMNLIQQEKDLIRLHELSITRWKRQIEAIKGYPDMPPMYQEKTERVPKL